MAGEGDMDMIFEDKEGLEDLEAMLYSQVHHDTTNSLEQGTTEAPVTNNVPVLYSRPSGKYSNRYWSCNINAAPRFGGDRQTNDKYSIRYQSTPVNKSYVSPLDAMRAQNKKITKKSNTGITLNASKGSPKNKGSNRKLSQNIKKGLYARKTEKLNRVLKYIEKSEKAKKAKEAGKGIVTEVVVIDSSSNDEDDVFEVPMPPPPLVTIDSSGEESSDEKNNTRSTLPKHKSLGSPSSSVVSDDFIGQRDRTRLTDERQIEDDSLQFPPQTLDTVINTNSKQTAEIANKDDNYRVDRTNLPNFDVYESASSDMPESSKFDCNYLQQTQKKLSNLGTKRAKKRKTSSINEIYENTSDSESSGTDETSKSGSPSLPIKQGEAVENLRGKLIFKPTRKRVNSDREFINMLSCIVHGDSSSEDDEMSSESEEDVTARVIAETVLNRVGEKLPQEVNDSSATNESTVSKENNSKEDNLVECEEAIPTDVANEVNSLFEKYENTGPNSSESQVKQMPPGPKKDDNSLEGFISVIQSNKPDLSWTDEMKKFYNDSWNGENFDVLQIRERMLSCKKWPICSEDRYVSGKPFTKLKCLNCLEFGHVARHCTKPKRDIFCHMCGECGHREPRCPNTICLQCGKKTKSYMRSCPSCAFQKRVSCSICKMQGHTIDLCPDNWRRYHSTTQPNTEPISEIVYNKRRKFCSVCARRGHTADNCRFSTTLLDYPLTTSYIQSHSKTYSDDQREYLDGKVGYNLFCNPTDSFVFNFSNEPANNYYGRFMNAVGLRGVRKRKSKILLNPFSKIARAEQTKLHQEGNQSSSFVKTLIKISPNVEHREHILKSININEPETHDTNEPESAVEQGAGNAKCEQQIDLNVENVLNDSSPLVENKSLPKRVAPMSPNTKFFLKMNIDDDVQPLAKFKANQINQTNNACLARIFLSKFHSKHLLNPNGNQFLIEISKKFSVKISFENTTFGNILVLEGEPANQDKFHKNLLEYFRSVLNEFNRDRLQRSQRVPRKSEALLRFLEQEVLLIKKNFGNISELIGRLRAAESQLTIRSWRLVERTRRILNIIFLGQFGLQEGKTHLQALNNFVKELQSYASDTIVSDDVRNQIQIHWSYIFSSQTECDYDKLIQERKNMKRLSPSKGDASQKTTGNKNAEPKFETPHSLGEQIENTDCSESEFWSKKCMKLIEDHIDLDKLPRKIALKLYRVKDKAKKLQLSSNDFKILCKVYDHINDSFAGSISKKENFQNET